MVEPMEAPLPPSIAAQELFRQHGTAVYRFAVAMLRHHQDAEDVVQETFLKLLRHLAAGGSAENIRGWLFTVAANALRDRQRGRSRWVPWGPDHEGTVAPPPLLDEDGRVKMLRDALHRLAPRDRLLLALRAQDLSYRDIAAATGIRFASVGRLLARAVDRCERAYAEQGRIDKTRAVKPERHGIL
jgi:RNA polymerase sigma-70 factor (ECF subfamily)